jgi:hypothetical protein
MGRMCSIVKMSGVKGVGSQKRLSAYITLSDKSNAWHILHYDYSHTPNFTLLHHMSAYFVY